MSLLISAGMPALSCYSRAICGRGTGSFRKESVARKARTTSDSNWCSTPNLQHLRAPGPALFWVQWKFRGCQSFTSPRPRPYSTWAPSPMFGGSYPLWPLFLRGNSTQTIPHERRHLKGRKFLHCCADASNQSDRKGATSTS